MTNTDDLWKRDEIESPCSKVCVLHPAAGICIGCHRTADEVRRWSRMTPIERRGIMDGLAARGSLLKSKRQGRAARQKNGASVANRPDDFIQK